jgi:small GTP-binding protein
MNDLRVAVAGHVDHGKSTIIGRLLYETGALSQQVAERFDRSDESQGAAALAFITDQLSEEQEGSFTLDTAQAHFRTARRDYTLIDTPGHREFLKNMVSGTTRADAAILVVDAAEGPLPQTYLHAYLISMLGIRTVILAINKMDLVGYEHNRFQQLSRQLSEHLDRLGIAPIAAIPMSAQRGDNITEPSARMEWNTTPPLVSVLDSLPHPEEQTNQPLRFVVQCPFEIDGCRAILGRVISGSLVQNQTIVFGPSGHETTVTSIRHGQQEAREASAGQCAGLILQDPTPVERGQMGFERNRAPSVTRRFAARIFWISTQSIEASDTVEVLCGTQTCKGRIQRIAKVIDPVSLEAVQTDALRLDDSQVADIILQTDSPLCVDAFGVVPESGRFAILHKGRIAGGGVIAT